MKIRDRRNGKGLVPPKHDPRKCEGGFTLLEVMIALGIIALSAVVLLGRQGEIYRDAERARDARTAWILASQKLAELELDKTLWQGDGSSSAGDFHEQDLPPPAKAVYSRFVWEYAITRVPVETVDPYDVSGPPKKPKEIFRLGLKVDAEGLDEPIFIEAMIPVPGATAAAGGTGTGASDDPNNPANPTDPADPAAPPGKGPGVPPRPAGLKK